MLKNKQTTNTFLWPLLTIGGILMFILLYYVATILYPGGSNFYPKENGFNWSTNYWCELLGKYAKNGQINTARPYAISAMLILSFSISLFWINFPKMIQSSWMLNRITNISGVLSMFSFCFIYTDFHDFSIFFSVISGSTALLITFYGLYKKHYKLFYQLCMICILLIFINNLIYLTNVMISYLPLLQKITFILVFIWIILICLQFIFGKKQLFFN